MIHSKKEISHSFLISQDLFIEWSQGDDIDKYQRKKMEKISLLSLLLSKSRTKTFCSSARLTAMREATTVRVLINIHGYERRWEGNFGWWGGRDGIRHFSSRTYRKTKKVPPEMSYWMTFIASFCMSKSIPD